MARPRSTPAGSPGGSRLVIGTVAGLAVAVVSGLVMLALGWGSFFAAGPESPPSSAPPPPPPVPTVAGQALESVVAGLETLVPEALRREGVPGASIALIGDGRLLWAKGYGLADRATGEAVTQETVFVGASLSKTMTAYLALKMVEDGVLELDRPLIDYAGEAYVSGARIKNVTLRMILSHTSGFTNMSDGRGAVVRDPGERWSYSSDAFRYLQWVIERVTETPFDQYAAAHLFVPLGLEGTSFVWREEFESLAARGYEAEGEVPRRKRTQANAAYGVLTRPLDVALLVEAIMNPVEGDPFRLGPASVAAMLTPQADAAEGVSWGLGWGLQNSDDVDGFWQWGWLAGSRNLVVADRESRAAVVVMTNGAGGLRVAKEIVRLVLPGEHPIFPSFIDHWE